MPEAEGTGLAKVLAVSQFCQFPLLSMAVNGVAVGGADARLDGAEVGGGGGANEDLLFRWDSKPELPTRLALAASAWPKVPVSAAIEPAASVAASSEAKLWRA